MRPINDACIVVAIAGACFTQDSRAATPTCPADLDGSQGISIGDLNILLSSWATDDGGDIDGDLDTDIDDLNLLLASWGMPCPLKRGELLTGRLYPLCTEPGAQPLSGPARPGVGDLNNDGIDDIVAKGGEYCQGVQILLGAPDRRLVPTRSFPLPSEYEQALIVDVNNDGYNDVVVTVSPEGLTTFINDGSGILVPSDFHDPWYRSEIASGDFNADGNVDIASVRGDHSLRIVYGDGSGGFGSPQSIALAGERSHLAVGDIDMNGSIDIVAGEGHEFSILLNADSTWTETTISADAPITTTRGQIDLGDINRDGWPDIIFAATESRLGQILSDGNGGFQTSAIQTGISDVTRYAFAADFNNDGFADAIAGTGTLSARVALRLNNSGLLAAPISAVCGGSFPEGIAHGDFDGDGFEDIVAVSDYLRILYGDGSGAFSSPHVIDAAPSSMNVVRFADFDGDGDLDLASAGTPGVRINLRNAQGEFPSSQILTGPNACPDMAIDDFDGDGDLDIAAIKGLSTLAFHTLLLNRGDGVFAESFLVGSGSFAEGIELADLNNDNRNDLIIANYLSSDLALYINNGNGTFSYSVSLPVGTHPVDISVADLNADGLDDIAVAIESSNHVQILFGNGVSGFVTPGMSYPHSGGQIHSLILQDLNNDTYPDLITSSSSPGPLVFRLNNGAGIFSTATEVGNGVSQAFLIGDLDDDRNFDLIGFENASAKIWLGDANGLFNEHPIRYGIGLNPRNAALIDLDGDGVQDIVSANGLGSNTTCNFGLPSQ